MAIEFVKGLPRGGKSLYVMGRILDEISEPNPRVIVSNLVIRHENVADYLVRRLGISRSKALLRARSLIYYLPDDQLKEFYRRRGFGRYLNPKTDRTLEGRASPVPDYNGDMEEWAVFYVLDEIHVVYDINGYRGEGEQVSYYLSQHGKLGEQPFDHVIVISQHPEQVSKKFKLLVQKWHTVRNRHMDKVGMFKMGAHFLRKEYMHEPKGLAVATDTQKFPFNQEIADCYDTLAGVGVRGRGVPRIAHAKGLPMWMLWAVGLGSVALVAGAIGFLPRLVFWFGKSSALVAKASPSSAGAALDAIKGASSGISQDPARSAPSAYPVHVDYPSRAVVFSDGSRAPLSQFGYVLTSSVAIVGGYRIPVVGRPVRSAPQGLRYVND